MCTLLPSVKGIKGDVWGWQQGATSINQCYTCGYVLVEITIVRAEVTNIQSSASMSFIYFSCLELFLLLLRASHAVLSCKPMRCAWDVPNGDLTREVNGKVSKTSVATHGIMPCSCVGFLCYIKQASVQGTATSVVAGPCTAKQSKAKPHNNNSKK